MWRNHLADIRGNIIGFKSSLTNPDLWYKPMITLKGIDYYAYILVFVDDILIIDKNPERFMDFLKDAYTLKLSSIRVYLEIDISKVYYHDNSYAWSMMPQLYVNGTIQNIKKQLSQDNLRFNKKLSDPNYSPKVPFSSVDYK